MSANVLISLANDICGIILSLRSRIQHLVPVVGHRSGQFPNVEAAGGGVENLAVGVVLGATLFVDAAFPKAAFIYFLNGFRIHNYKYDFSLILRHDHPIRLQRLVPNLRHRSEQNAGPGSRCASADAGRGAVRGGD